MQYYISPKKALGQHFLADPNIARKIAGSLTGYGGYGQVLEVGPGTGMLTRHLVESAPYTWYGAEIDPEAVALLKQTYPGEAGKVIQGDFLRVDLGAFFSGEFAVIGNFPYNISSQIVFKVLENRSMIPEVVGMFQKEVAMRIASAHGSKAYGILSVLTQAFYDVRVLFHVDPHVFNPPPKVQSTVLRMTRKQEHLPGYDEKMFFRVVKTAFNQRRKTLRNSLKSLGVRWDALPEEIPGLRAEQIPYTRFIEISRNIELLNNGKTK